MDALKVFEAFTPNWEHLKFELAEGSNSDKAVAITDITAKDYFTDEVHVKFYIFKEGTIHMFFIFDKIKRNLTNYNLINDFNDSTSWAKGYITKINDQDFFEVHYAYYDAKDEDAMVTHLNEGMKDLLSDAVLEKLRAICNYTY